MTVYLVEEYRVSGNRTEDVGDRARRAASELTGSGIPVSYEQSIFVPGDEMCLHLLRGPSREAVLEAARRAGISPVRVVETAP